MRASELSRLSFARRFRAAIAFTVVGFAALGSAIPQAHAADAAVEFMRRAANELINAQRQGSPTAFARVIRKYGHVPVIGLDALGSYRAGLRPASRRKYQGGVVKFISRYAATESRKYRVRRVTFAKAASREGQHVLVDSRVFLADGAQYDVRWMLVPRGRNRFKVRDAQVLGFWVSPFLRQLFENYIAENGGRVDALVIALNR
ncbi:MAG: ABC transporter substrate-binding protein, partial [Pseudomonadota bacterium]